MSVPALFSNRTVRLPVPLKRAKRIPTRETLFVGPDTVNVSRTASDPEIT
jgi:hypothetical protein